MRKKRDTVSESPVDLSTVHSVPLHISFYLSCPIDSYHAVYTWEHSDHISPCMQMQSNCLHLIPNVTEDNYGTYKCVSKEKDYTKVVKTYHLQDQPHVYRRNYFPTDRNHASTIVLEIAWITYGVTIIMLGIFR